MVWWILRIILVVALLCVAAAMATPKGRLPLALRGLQKIIARDRADAASRQAASDAPPARQSAAKRFVAFMLVVLAVLVAVS